VPDSDVRLRAAVRPPKLARVITGAFGVKFRSAEKRRYQGTGQIETKRI
jgi:hypothetical protein